MSHADIEIFVIHSPIAPELHLDVKAVQKADGDVRLCPGSINSAAAMNSELAVDIAATTIYEEHELGRVWRLAKEGRQVCAVVVVERGRGWACARGQ